RQLSAVTTHARWGARAARCRRKGTRGPPRSPGRDPISRTTASGGAARPRAGAGGGGGRGGSAGCPQARAAGGRGEGGARGDAEGAAGVGEPAGGKDGGGQILATCAAGSGLLVAGDLQGRQPVLVPAARAGVRPLEIGRDLGEPEAQRIAVARVRLLVGLHGA